MKSIKKSILSWILVFSMILPLLSSVIYTQASESDLKDYNAMTMEEILESGESLTWVIAGDSITHNANWTAGVNSYGEWIEQRLYELDERKNDSVVLSGWGGADIRDFLAESPSSQGTNEDPGMGVENFITKYNPDVITIKLGMNNRSMSTSDFTTYYKQMLDDIYSICAEQYGKKPKIILLSPTPLQSENIYDDTYHVTNDDAIKESTLRIRNAIEEIANAKGLLFCDLRTAFMDAQVELGEDYSHTFFVDPSDGLHPNEAGQYCMFKAVSKTLGIYDESKPIYQYTYEDLDYHALYADSTEFSFDSEMDKTMPTLSDATPIASVEFDNLTGILGLSGTSGFDIHKQTTSVTDPLTLADVKTIEKEYTVVFRAKLETPNQKNAPILSFASNDLDSNNWDNAFTLGTHGNTNQMYYHVRQSGTSYVNGGGTFNIGSSTVSGDDNWHTIAIVQREDCLEYYVDGVLDGSDSTRYLTTSISELFTSATTFTATIGSYGGKSATSYNLEGSFDYWQFYATALSSDQIAELAQSNVETKVVRDTVSWNDAFAADSVWAVMGGSQMAGYETNVVNRSLMRYIENAMRGSSGTASYRDIRMYNMATPGYDVADMVTNYDTLVDERTYNVFMLYPELTDVYESDYVHSDDLVAAYKTIVETLLKNNSEKVKILWTPLASNNETINGYITAYAKAVREIAADDISILLFDANQFMNEKMVANTSLLNNWFEDGAYVSPLCTVDVARAFYIEMGQSYTGRAELSSHNLRYTSDKKVYKGQYVNDYIAASVEVSDDTTVAVDMKDIADAYPEVELKIVVLPYKGAGNYNADIVDLDSVATVNKSGSVWTFKAPCSELNLAIYGEDETNGVIYRFKDISLTVDTDATMPEISEELTEVCLDSLEVMSVPEIGFDKDKTECTGST